MHRLAAVAVLLPAAAFAQDVVVVPSPKTPAELIVSLVPHVIGLVALVMTGYVLPALKNWLVERGKTNKLANVALRVEHLAEACVAHLNAGLRAQFELAAADGKITAEEAAALKADGMRLMKEFLGAQGLTTVAGVLGIGAGLVDTYLSGMLEKSVEKAHVAATVVAGPAQPIAPVPL